MKTILLLVTTFAVLNLVNSEGYCSTYHGNICKKYVDHSKYIWYNISGGYENEQITTALWDEIISVLSEPCRSAAEKMLCVYAFPDCNVSSPLPLCYEDCIAVKELFCYKEWAVIEDQKANGVHIKSRGHFRLPDCNILPKYRENVGKNVCSYAGLTDVVESEVTYDCIKGKGRYYQGKVNITKEGIPCQRWDSQDPQVHNSPPDVFMELKNAENYCRNAGGEEKMPWCFTTNPAIRWQYCQIPRCLNSTSEEGEFPGIKMEAYFSPTFIIIMSCLGMFAIVLCLLFILLCHKIYKRRLLGYNAPTNAEVNIDLDKLPSNVQYHRHGVPLNPKLEKLEYPRNDIIYLRDLGQGAFGSVFQAKAPGLVSGEEFTIVAVKMLKDDASEDMQEDFEKEACLLSEFDHPNIVRLLGVCAVGRPMCLLFEYMGKGDLNEFLRQCSPTNYVVRSAISGEFTNKEIYKDFQLTHRDQIFIAIQIASGMVYLSDRKFVHRDLATRNCLINDDMVVKIADFGLSQKIYLQDYYKGTDRDAIPVRWMPLESILYNKYTSETDVWAFGVCLWEIFSFALQPYYGSTHEEVIKFLKEGNIMPSPENTPGEVYELMRMCWAQKPHDRPCFRVVYDKLMEIYESTNSI
ncbi:tyrosine-protein kinase transmembrane receptor Ror2 [Anthonomus grandis grandis]|uniref:tyrosine-protein kinase transmembrane receptor Ror2 n=1 Tax=Anthonomus grandis grandis TaxID=2921223 RepID=UPI0021652890|nr:tyrosine-protein kinase transmembrane receptor Ror2 [Anthonomus grandis grandis]